MSNVITLNPKEIISITDNELTTTSVLVAKTFNKRHRDIVRKIETMDIPNDFKGRNFSLTDFIDKNGDTQKCYEMNKDGFVFLVMSFTGKLANQIKIAYIEAFNFMANQLVKQQQPKLESPYIDDEQLQHIKTGVSKMVRATGKSFPTVYNELFDFVKAPSVRQIRKERYELACQFLGINPDFKVKADLVLLPKPKVDYIADIPFDVRRDADYTVQVRRGKVRKAKLIYCTDPQDEQQDWWLKI
ncbi:MAG: Rha family transcriptional regulator [Gammaproteobacteria bacterium]|nr:Rha family transcriptional regulator [Gammaproteobacteria bacterium]